MERVGRNWAGVSIQLLLHDVLGATHRLKLGPEGRNGTDAETVADGLDLASRVLLGALKEPLLGSHFGGFGGLSN